MAIPRIGDALWIRVEGLLPPPKPRRFRFPGRKRIPDRKVLTGILYLLSTGIPFDQLPTEMGCGTGMTCWNRLAEWKRAGAWPRIRRLLEEELPSGHKLDWNRVDRVNTRKRRS